ncbi:hypothetical protein, partial [uncultured Acetatifactor sp.]|uniref:hypothetical protein n=1 Tax=uncultured Acetatifactor sp. TaxID=1671927 RepID=UPI0026F3D005
QPDLEPENQRFCREALTDLSSEELCITGLPFRISSAELSRPVPYIRPPKDLMCPRSDSSPRPLFLVHMAHQRGMPKVKKRTVFQQLIRNILWAECQSNADFCFRLRSGPFLTPG